MRLYNHMQRLPNKVGFEFIALFREGHEEIRRIEKTLTAFIV